MCASPLDFFVKLREIVFMRITVEHLKSSDTSLYMSKIIAQMDRGSQK